MENYEIKYIIGTILMTIGLSIVIGTFVCGAFAIHWLLGILACATVSIFIGVNMIRD